MPPGYVYTYPWHGAPEALQAHLDRLGQPLTYWAADEGHLEMGQGTPKAWRDRGAVFGPEGELRWWRDGEVFRVLLLVDHPIEGLSQVPGEWSTEEQEFDLQNLHEPRVKPSFDRYPNGHHQGRLVARLFRRDGTPMWISPRYLK
ncbi:MAG TPA: hypothetical protein VNK89_08145 [Thermoflexus sp.]|nr:hypothetical protein [Thermoflexus sp.]